MKNYKKISKKLFDNLWVPLLEEEYPIIEKTKGYRTKVKKINEFEKNCFSLIKEIIKSNYNRIVFKKVWKSRTIFRYYYLFIKVLIKINKKIIIPTYFR